jgi:hypothetical protein
MSEIQSTSYKSVEYFKNVKMYKYIFYIIILSEQNYQN